MKKISFVFIFFILFSTNAFSQNKPVVQDIQAAAAKGTRINVYWTLPDNVESAITKLFLYRDTKVISSYSQLANAELIAQLPAETCGYTDNVSDYNDYYYAVIAYTDKPYDVIFLSMNSTVYGVHLIAPKQKEITPKEKNDEKLYPEGTMRETPLPFINYVEGQNNSELISEKTAKATNEFSVYIPSSDSAAITPYFFEEDLVSPDGGDDFLLFEVLKNSFVQEKYEEAIVSLKKLDGTNISETVRNRVNFYIAEAYFFTGDFEEAAKYFVKVAHVYPLETKIWINNTLDRMALPQY